MLHRRPRTRPRPDARSAATPARRRPVLGVLTPRPQNTASVRFARPALALAAALVSALVALLLVGPAGSPAQAAVSTPSGWTHVWSDDFTGSTGSKVDSANWLYDIGHCYPGCPAWNWGTGEIEYMTDSTANVYQDGNGNLVIKPIRDASGNWTSGRIETQRTDFAAPSGGVMRLEGRIQMPNVTGSAAQGIWPAFWALGAPFRGVYTNWPIVGELDIMENVNGANTVWGTLHCGYNPGGPCNETNGLGGSLSPCPNYSCQSGFHTYAIEYDRSTSPEQLRWYVDGVNYFTLNQTAMDATTWSNALHHGFFMILNVAIGGGWPGSPTSSTASGVPMLVDYVAVFTRGGGSTPTITTITTTTKPTSSPTPTPTKTTKPPKPTKTTTTKPTTSSPGGSGGVNAYGTIQAEAFTAQSGAQVESTGDTGGGQNVGWLGNGDWLRYDKVDFGNTPARNFQARVASGVDGGASGLVEVRLDSLSNAPIGSIALGNSGGWQNWRTVPANISGVTGVHTVYLTFTSGQPADFVNVNWFTFVR